MLRLLEEGSYGSPTAQFAPTWQLMYISQTGNFFVYTSTMEQFLYWPTGRHFRKLPLHGRGEL